MIPSPMLMRGFVYPQHCSYATELFNHGSQSCRLGITSTGDYIFSPNVVRKTLRLVNIGLLQARHFSDGLLTFIMKEFFKAILQHYFLFCKLLHKNFGQKNKPFNHDLSAAQIQHSPF